MLSENLHMLRFLNITSVQRDKRSVSFYSEGTTLFPSNFQAVVMPLGQSIESIPQ